jgi:hypothetical protein
MMQPQQGQAPQQQQGQAPQDGDQAFTQMLQSQPQIMAQMQQMPPEEQAEFMRKLYQDYTGQEGIASEQMAQADALRNEPMSKGVHTQSGFVAANPMSGVANLMNKYQGNKDYDKAMEAKKALSQDRTGGVSGLAKMKMQADQLRKKDESRDEMLDLVNQQFGQM